ncbi:MAG TPA: glycosyltransferase [Candidatus Limnocylindrales bacterium]|nr:glycosyltransferase [Candidatus Limnocylindrales bacterium]
MTVIGSNLPGETKLSREDVDGYTIIRVPIVQGTAWWATWLRAPWKLVALGLRSAGRNLLRGPRGWLRAVAVLVVVLVSAPWIVLRAGWYGVVNKGLGRPLGFGGVLLIRRWRAEILPWDRAAVAAAPTADVHHAHDMEALPAAHAGARRDGGRYVYDSHEIFMEWGAVLDAPSWARWAFAQFERRLVAGAEALVTINASIADYLTRRLRPRRVVVVHNCPQRWTPPTVPENRIRRTLGLGDDVSIVLCHGGFLPNRGLEQTAEAMTLPGLERAHLVFIGYRVKIVEPILDRADLRGRVHYLEPVPPDEVPAWVAGADVDVMTLLPTDLNNRLSTPNKLFESIAAGTPVVSSDFEERRRIIMDNPGGPLGAVCDPTSPEAIAAAIRSILDLSTPDREALRERCLAAARDRWNWEAEVSGLLALYAGFEAPAS